LVTRPGLKKIPRRTLEAVNATNNDRPSPIPDPLLDAPSDAQASREDGAPRREGLSWGAMMALVALAILVATACAYLLVNPFFHQRAP
jgi:hypothetical protein